MMKPFHDETLVAKYALVDPDLLASCPPDLIAANGMDAFTQLLEAYDALALARIEAVRDGLFAWYLGGKEAPVEQARMALAALLSGICLAQAGLDSVHGLAQPLGSLFPIPHGVVCSTLVAAARVNSEAMQAREPDHPALTKYAIVGRLLVADPSADDACARESLLTTLEGWTRLLKLPGLSDLGVATADLGRIVANSRGSSMKTDPVDLRDAEIERILRLRFGG